MEGDLKQNRESESIKIVGENNATDPETEIRKVVNRHIQNEDDVISEEEFRDLKVGVPLTPEEEQIKPEAQFENKNTAVEGKSREREQIISWNILDENSDTF